jgi:hypothetical protein
MSDATDDLVKSIRKPWEVMRDVINKVPDQKQQYTDMHKNMVDKANQSFKDAADKEDAKKNAGKKPVPRKRG